MYQNRSINNCRASGYSILYMRGFIQPKYGNGIIMILMILMVLIVLMIIMNIMNIMILLTYEK